jgi:predicted DNA-binding protein YlxM (UPF0122 family)
LAPTGGIRPPIRKRSKLVLTLSEREEISRGIIADLSIPSIAKHFNRSPSTNSPEIKRNGGVIITIEQHKLIFLHGSGRIAPNDVSWLVIDH